jgi:Asp-tRNA(Asn)/Glu-tRNA(Gln) amidotransferase A subunit family amidase
LGKTTTTEFAATTAGPKTRNPHDPKRTPGGSSSGSGAAVGDFQAPIALGTQTGGSTIRPGSFNGIYAFKPTWNSITREGQKIYSLIFDTLGLYARCVTDLELLADVFAIHDDEPAPTDFSVKGAKFALLKTMVWPNAGPGLVAVLDKAVSLLREQGAEVQEISLPAHLDSLPEWHRTVLSSDGRTAFLPEYTVAKDKISTQLVGHVENSDKISRKAQLTAFDAIAAARPVVDEILSKYDAVLTPSVPDEAPLGIEKTGSAAFCSIWTVRCIAVRRHIGRANRLKGFTHTGTECARLQGRKQHAHWYIACCAALSRQKSARSRQGSWCGFRSRGWMEAVCMSMFLFRSMLREKE